MKLFNRMVVLYLFHFVGLNLFLIEMYFIKHLEKTIYAMINSNKELAKSNEKYANRMVLLTIALVFAAFAQIIVPLDKVISIR